jgi:hypothetical protein
MRGEETQIPFGNDKQKGKAQCKAGSGQRQRAMQSIGYATFSGGYI